MKNLRLYFYKLLKQSMSKFITYLKKFYLLSKPRIKSRRSYDECVIFGSGPSIDKIDLNNSFFKDKDFISCNYVHKNNICEYIRRHTRMHELTRLFSNIYI